MQPVGARLEGEEGSGGVLKKVRLSLSIQEPVAGHKRCIDLVGQIEVVVVAAVAAAEDIPVEVVEVASVVVRGTSWALHRDPSVVVVVEGEARIAVVVEVGKRIVGVEEAGKASAAVVAAIAAAEHIVPGAAAVVVVVVVVGTWVVGVAVVAVEEPIAVAVVVEEAAASVVVVVVVVGIEVVPGTVGEVVAASFEEEEQ